MNSHAFTHDSLTMMSEAIRPRRRYLVPPAVAENHQGGSNFRFSTNDFDCAGRGALTSEGPHRIDHAHGYGSNFYRSEHRHSNCSRPRCLSVALATSTCCATLAKTTLGEVRDRGSTAGFSVGCRRSQASKSIVHKSWSLNDFFASVAGWHALC